MTRPNIALLASLLLLLPLLGHPQWSRYEVPSQPDGPSTPLIQLIDDHYRHPMGMGFLFELDLGSLPKSVKTDALQPVRSLEWTRADRPSESTLPDRTRNPLMGLFYGIASLGKLARKPPVLLPLPYQPVFPLDSGVVLDEEGTLHVLARPATGRIRLFIPHLLAEDGGRLYLMLVTHVGHELHVQSPALNIPRTIPDIELTLLDTEPGRYLGAQGQWVRLRYQPPAYLASEHTTAKSPRLRVLLNGACHVPRPDPDGPDSWGKVGREADTLRCFVPDALARADGSMELEVMLAFGYSMPDRKFTDPEEFRTMTSLNKIVLQGKRPAQRLRVRFFEFAQKVKPKPGKGDPYVDFNFLYTLGGIRVHASEKASDSLSVQKLIRWSDTRVAEVPLLPGDELGILICSLRSDWFEGYTNLYFQLSATDFPREAKVKEVVKEFESSIGTRYRWTLRAEYEWLDGGLE